MPDMDGFTLAEAIQRDAGLAETRLLMLTSSAHGGDAARCREIGVAAYLTKPLGAAELLEAVLRVTGAKPDSGAAPALVTHQLIQTSRAALRILVVDDNPVNRRLAVRLLEKHGHSVHEAISGKAALDELGVNQFDAVLMDVQMPEMDGFEATRAIRGRELHTGAHVPVIAMTAHAMHGDRDRCLAAGMDGYIAKPISAKDLLHELETAVSTPAFH